MSATSDMAVGVATASGSLAGSGQVQPATVTTDSQVDTLGLDAKVDEVHTSQVRDVWHFEGVHRGEPLCTGLGENLANALLDAIRYMLPPGDPDAADDGEPGHEPL